MSLKALSTPAKKTINHMQSNSFDPKVPHQMSALTFFRYEQPVLDYCQAHQPMRLNVNYDCPPQGLDDLAPRDRGTIQTVALPAVPPSGSPPILRTPVQGPGIPYPGTERSVKYPSIERPTSTLTFRR
ncbi:leucine-rich repeat transmembrane neuronal protein 4 [Tachysurus ichikawai]